MPRDPGTGLAGNHGWRLKAIGMDFFLIFTSFLVVVWTVRLARSKGRHPWMWGGAALILSTISNFNLPMIPIAGMIPIVILLFLRRRQDGVDATPAPPVCPKCNTLHSRDHRYCVNCGWELTRPYVGETSTGEEQVSTSLGSQYAEPKLATADSSPVQSAEPEAEPVAEAGSSGQAEPTPPEPVLQDAPTGDSTERQEEAPAGTEVRRRRGVPTAAGMTEWGINLFNLGRIQESIDQFTKAIALDPNFKMAWERRAESYAKLGRGEEAAEDRRRLRALNATPSAG